MNTPMPPDKDSDFPNYQHKQGWEMPEIPPIEEVKKSLTLDEARKAAPDDRPKKGPPEPPKPRCIANEPGYLEKSKRYSELCVLLSFSLLFITALIITFYPDPRLDPMRTDHAVQAGIRECERTLPRTQTCELSQLSFKVVEKKQW